MNLNRKGYYTATVLGLIILAMGLGMGWFAGRTSEPQQPESITVKEPEEQEDTPVAAEEKFAVTTVNIFECGHIIERGENVTATAREAEGIMQQYGGYNYELKDGKMALYREFGYCCPEHYFTGEQNGKIAVFEADPGLFSLRFHSSQRDNLCYTRFLQPLQFAEAVFFCPTVVSSQLSCCGKS